MIPLFMVFCFFLSPFTFSLHLSFITSFFTCCVTLLSCIAIVHLSFSISCQLDHLACPCCLFSHLPTLSPLSSASYPPPSYTYQPVLSSRTCLHIPSTFFLLSWWPYTFPRKISTFRFFFSSRPFIPLIGIPLFLSFFPPSPLSSSKRLSIPPRVPQFRSSITSH